jgi:ABC transport system ATP-binding/permease protein
MKELEFIEMEIERMEKNKTDLEQQINSSTDDYKSLEKFSIELNDTINKIEELTNRWLELSEKET